MKTRAEFEAMISPLRAAHARARRWARAHDGQPFSAPTEHRCSGMNCRGGCGAPYAVVAVVVSRSLLVHGEWRVTTLCADGDPWGHTDHATHGEAVMHAWQVNRAELRQARFLAPAGRASCGLEVRA